MLVEFTITPLGSHSHISTEVAEAVKIVDASGLNYQLVPLGTCVEGDWDAVMSVIKRCHDRVRQLSPHVMTTIRIEDEQGAQNKLIRNVTSIEEKLGHPLHREITNPLVGAGS